MPPARNATAWWYPLMLCLATAVAITNTAYLCAWLDYRGQVAWTCRPEQVMTRHFLEELREEIEQHRVTTGKLPASLADLEVLKQRQAGQPADEWGRPVHY